ncbi:hypothetical protein FH972_020736 [Carpinus fangiana]|uniref:MBD domain-containing protein n=1 Tax=Carpinus fangiana TaxID=176857 RepID=A0A5N6RVN6_9ROSI|nr:hypothetical protein FH972_020736 [Carpinus fangiana]
MAYRHHAAVIGMPKESSFTQAWQQQVLNEFAAMEEVGVCLFTFSSSSSSGLFAFCNHRWEFAFSLSLLLLLLKGLLVDSRQSARSVAVLPYLCRIVGQGARLNRVLSAGAAALPCSLSLLSISFSSLRWEFAFSLSPLLLLQGLLVDSRQSARSVAVLPYLCRIGLLVDSRQSARSVAVLPYPCRIVGQGARLNRGDHFQHFCPTPTPTLYILEVELDGIEGFPTLPTSAEADYRRPLSNSKMRSSPENLSPRVRKGENDFSGSSFLALQDSTNQEPIDDGSLQTDDEDDLSNENASKQLVLYDPSANGTGAIEPVPDPIQSQRPTFRRYLARNSSSRVLPSVGAFTVQCAKCFKWRLIPTKEKYEEIREHILEQPFYCETAREWRPDISCDDPADITQDGSRLWAIDKPNIAQPPPGWQRLLRIRGEGSTKFADIYYEAPSGKRLRSIVEIQKYLLEHPEYMRDGVTLSQFSFQIPKPLQKDYVRKRTPLLTTSLDTRPLEPGEAASPLAWAGPDDSSELQLNRPGLPPYLESPVFDPVERPAKKQATASTQEMYSSKPIHNKHSGRG